MSRAWILVKKIFSLSLVFNALLTIACVVSIFGGFYFYFQNWQPFYPFLVNGNILWIVIAAATLNIFPSALIGRPLKTGRFLFHHYFYGFLVFAAAMTYAIIFAPVSLLTIFLVDNTSVAVNVGRFFLIGGFTLILDDLPDVHSIIEFRLNWMKAKAKTRGKVISAVQLFTGVVSLYVFVAVCLAMAANPEWITVANFLLIGSVFITSVTSFMFVKRSFWVNIR